MKRLLACVLLLTLVSGAGLVFAYDSILAEREQVAFNETTVAGDASLAEGKELLLSYSAGNGYRWYITVGPGKEPVTTASFERSKAVVQEFPAYLNKNHSNDVKIERAFNDQGDGTNYYVRQFSAIFQDVRSRAPAGERYSESVALKDYYDRYPLYVEVGNYAAYPGKVEEHYTEQLTEAFAVPVDEDDKASVIVETDRDGKLKNYSLRFMPSHPKYEVSSLAVDDGYYMLVISKDPRTRDRSGVYFLPKVEAKTVITEAHDLQHICKLSGDLLDNFFLTRDPADERLRLTLEQENGIRIVQVDPADGAILQDEVFNVRPSSEVTMSGFLEKEDSLLCFVGGEQSRVCVIAKNEAGLYEQVLDQPCHPADTIHRINNGFTFDWDGRRLSLFANQSPDNRSDWYTTGYGGYSAAGFYLSIYDQAGSFYVGRYDCSLDSLRDHDTFGMMNDIAAFLK